VSCSPDAVSSVLAEFAHQGFADAAAIGRLDVPTDGASTKLHFQ
jgi:hypothetical protein